MARDLGQTFNGTVHSDASAALGIVNRTGLGKLRHINVQFLWVQNKATTGELGIQKVPGKDNPADLLTKHLTAADVQKHCEEISLTRTETRAESAPNLNTLNGQNLIGDIATELQMTETQVAKGLERGDGDFVEGPGGLLAVVHRRPRTRLFFPSRVDGQPPREVLTALRESFITDTATGVRRVVRDSWTSRRHADIERPWIGWTLFRRSS